MWFIAVLIIAIKIGKVLNLSIPQRFTCSLNGVSCLKYIVVSIDLSNNEPSYTGTIPSNIGLYTGLTSLVLSSNCLTGSIPSEIGQLQSLIYLDLSVNSLTGEIPIEIFDLGSLSTLWLHKNSLSGSISTYVGKYQSLNSLLLHSNSFSGEIPTEIGNLISLSSLSCNDNYLEGAIPKEIGNLIHLTILELASNDIGGYIPTEIGKLTSLVYLIVGENLLSGMIPTELGYLIKLSTLDLNNNCLEGSIPKELLKLTSLTTLWLCTNLLTGAIPNYIWKLVNLESLWLDANYLQGKIPTYIGKFVKLNDLDLSENILSGSIPTELYSITKLTALRLSENSLNGVISTHIGQLKSLVILMLYSNILSNVIPTEIGLLTSLDTLYLDDNELKGVVPSDIGNLIYLKYLELGANYISGSIPTEIGKLTALISLSLDFNNLSGSIPNEIGEIVSLTYLDISYNELVGTIPMTMSNLESLKNLFMIGNLLCGPLPSGLCSSSWKCELKYDEPDCFNSEPIVSTPFPSYAPLEHPTVDPSLVPSHHASSAPSSAPSQHPSSTPSLVPSQHPSSIPSSSPSQHPSSTPSLVPSQHPSSTPSLVPSQHPSSAPSSSPSQHPSSIPSSSPSQHPSSTPSLVTSQHPSSIPSSSPSQHPSSTPSLVPSQHPSSAPSSSPSRHPSSTPSLVPSQHPSSTPSLVPSQHPSSTPSFVPSQHPSSAPSSSPSQHPSSTPSLVPSQHPSSAPSSSPSQHPSSTPSLVPSQHPSSTPSFVPSQHPSFNPSFVPSQSPISASSMIPSRSPTYDSFLFPSVYGAIQNATSITELSEILSKVDFNKSSLLNMAGQSCTTSIDCASGNCKDGICESENKICLSTLSNSSCSGNGVCTYWDTLGSQVDSCALSNSSCAATCSCYSGFAGEGCYMSNVEYNLTDAAYFAGCFKLREQLSNSSLRTITGAINMTHNVFSSHAGLSEGTIKECTQTLSAILDFDPDSSHFNGSDFTASTFFSALSFGFQNTFRLALKSDWSDNSNQIIKNLMVVLDGTIHKILDSVQEDQSLSFTTPTFNISLFKQQWEDLPNIAFTVSNSSLTLSDDGLNVCKDTLDNDRASFSVMEWFFNPYPNEKQIQNRLLRWTRKQVRQTRNLRYQDSKNSSFFLAIPFISQKNFSMNLNVFNNFTIRPSCQYWERDHYADCGCITSSFNEYSATFKCDVARNLCPSVLIFQSSINLLADNPKQEVDERDFGVILSKMADDSSKVLESGSQDVSLAVVGVTAAWVILLLLGGLYFYRWDVLDRNVLLYAPPKSNIEKYNDLATLDKFQQRLDEAFLGGYLQNNVDYSIANLKSEDFEMRSSRVSSIYSILNCLPSSCFASDQKMRFSLLVGGEILPRIMFAIKRFNPLFSLFSFGSLQISRLTRYLNAFKTILLFMAVSASLFYTQYLDSELNLPQSSPAFIITSTLITAIITLPIDFIIYLLLVYVCAKTPNFKRPESKPFSFLNESEGKHVDAIIEAFSSFGAQYNSGFFDDDDLRKVDLIITKLGLYFNKVDSTVKLTSWSSIRFKDLRSCVTYHIHKACVSAQAIVDNLSQLDDSASRDSYLIQQFTLEQFGFAFRGILRRQFGHILFELPMKINPVIWVLSWAFVFGWMILMISWIVLWGTLHGGSSVALSWGTVWLLNFILDVFLVSTIGILLVDILAVKFLQWRLVKLHEKLCQVSDVSDEENLHTLNIAANLTSPACLAANDPDLKNYTGARVLRMFYRAENDWSDEGRRGFAFG